jgi:hypothetical protein
LVNWAKRQGWLRFRLRHLPYHLWFQGRLIQPFQVASLRQVILRPFYLPHHRAPTLLFHLGSNPRWNLLGKGWGLTVACGLASMWRLSIQRWGNTFKVL